MRSVLTWLMVFCVMAGLNARVLGAQSLHVGTCSHTHVEEPCCDHSHDRGPDCQNHEHKDGKCPSESHHHHHGCCPVGQPLTVENEHFRQPGIPASSLLGVRLEGDVLPEEPHLGSEKPPLI